MPKNDSPYTQPTVDPDALFRQLRGIKMQWAVSHVTAWLLHELELPHRMLTSNVDVSVPPTSAPPRRRGVRAFRRNTPPETQQIAGLRVTTPMQTWLDLAMLQPPLSDLVACGDVLARNHPHIPNSLKLMGVDVTGIPGVRLARRAAKMVRTNVLSVKETEMRVRIVEAGLPEPLVNADLKGWDGRTLGWGDLVYPDERLVIEYEGLHHARKGQFVRDVGRDRNIREAGWHVMRFTGADLDDPNEAWLDQVQAAYQKHHRKMLATW